MRRGASYSTRSLEINGFSKKEIYDRSKPSAKRLVTEFCSWASKSRDRTLAGHNVHLDIDFLRDSIRRYGIRISFGHRNVDTHAVTYTHILSRNLRPPILNGRTDINSDYVFNYVGIGSEPHPHKAINGAMMEAEALGRIIYGRPLLAEFKNRAVPAYLLRPQGRTSGSRAIKNKRKTENKAI